MNECTLAQAPVGLFLCGEELCLKTEYMGKDGRIDAYIVSSGEFFWGGTDTGAAQREVKVRPVEFDMSMLRPINPPTLEERVRADIAFPIQKHDLIPAGKDIVQVVDDEIDRMSNVDLLRAISIALED